MTRWLGIDCGGTNTKLLVAEEARGGLRTVAREKIPTPRRTGGLGTIADAARRLLGRDSVSALGMAVPGIIDDRSGVVEVSVNLAWLEGTAPAATMSAVLEVPGGVVHDGAAAARAEATLGAAKDHSDAFIVALGTGIAGAHVVNGAVRRGAHGAAGEIGHIHAGGDRACSCGQRGCLETLIGGNQLAARWRELGGGDQASARDLLQAAAAGDPLAAQVVATATDALAGSLLGLVAMVDPEIIVLGGGIARARAQVVEPTIATVARSATFHRLPPIVPAELGMWGAAWGAVLAAREAAGRTGAVPPMAD